MKKVVSLLLAAALSVGAWSIPVVAHAEGGGWTADEAELARWETFAEGGSATVGLENSTEHTGESGSALKVTVDKDGSAFAGVRADFSAELSEAIGMYEGVVGFSFSLYNGLALPADNSLVVKVGLTNEDWTVTANQTQEKALPSLSETGGSTVSIDFAYLPEGASVGDVKNLVIGVDGSADAELYVYDINVRYSDTQIAEGVRTNVPTANTVGSIAFGAFQYGGAEGTTTKKESVTAADKSKETDGSALHVGIDGSGSYADRIYSVYFPLAGQKGLVSLVNPVAISFWVYNEGVGGGFLFKLGTEITSGIKVFDENNEELTDKENDRNLDYTGFRRYEISCTAEQLNANELEIGVWGGSAETSYYLSAVSFIDIVRPVVGELSLGSVSALNFTNYSTTNSMEKLTGTNADYSHEAGGAYVGISRAEAQDFDVSSIYMQSFAETVSGSGAGNPTAIVFWAYNATMLANGGLMFAFGGTEVTSLTWEDGTGAKGTDRDLNFTGMRKYTVYATAENVAKAEFQIGVWGTGAAEIYFSDFSAFDSSTQTVTASGSRELLATTSVDPFEKIETTAEANLSVKDGALSFSSASEAYMTRSLGGLFSAENTGLTIALKADAAYGPNAVTIALLYDDGSGVSAAYTAASVGFLDTEEHTVTVNIGDMPYYIAAKNVTGVRIGLGKGEEKRAVSLCDITAEKDDSAAAKESYSYVVSDFENASQVSQWGLSKASGTEAVISYSSKAKVGNGALSYRFGNVLYDFGWTEIYFDVESIISANADKDVKGISFWLYNETYIQPGALGFWLKVAQSDNPEFEAMYSSITAEKHTDNNLGFTGWNKIEIPFSADAYTEQNYYEGYDAANPHSFDWTKLKYIKIGFWGTFYDNELGYSCNTVIDDVRLVSAKPLSEDNPTVGYSIDYNLNGGKLPGGAQESYTTGDAFKLPTPTRKGYTFAGWYTDGALTGEPVTEITAEMTGDLTLYAAWTKGGEKKPVGLIVGLSVGGAAVIAAGAVAFVFVRKKKRKS